LGARFLNAENRNVELLSYKVEIELEPDALPSDKSRVTGIALVPSSARDLSIRLLMALAF
jgi:hypothetical protein